MTAPDRIWAWTYKDCDWKSAWTVDDEDAPPHAVEYIRADLAAVSETHKIKGENHE
jgi:hypothetical protein